jgi:hypothetical protein
MGTGGWGQEGVKQFLFDWDFAAFFGGHPCFGLTEHLDRRMPHRGLTRAAERRVAA